MINVTKPFFPPLDEYNGYLQGIWKREWLTNNGPLVNDLELRLKNFLGVKHLLYVSNGTVALQLSIKALNLSGEVITTPFSYVATTSSILWEGCKPVFVDIDPNTFNLDPRKIESAITKNTTAILATHVFGAPCEIEEIERIAYKHGIKTIYDGAHSFGTLYKGKSLLDYGDISTSSFHATKLYHTGEGGAVISNDKGIIERVALLRNFGHDGPEDFPEVGINGKNSELHAALGLANLKYIDAILDRRKVLFQHYNERLIGLRVLRQMIGKDVTSNHAYYPVVFRTENELHKSIIELNAHRIFPRRYFWPSLNTLSYTKGMYSCSNSEDISRRILCLPLYHELELEEINLICRILLRVQNN